MRYREIEKRLQQAARWRALGTENGDKNAVRCENAAAELFADGLRRFARRNPHSKYGLKSYHKLHATGTGSGGHNQPKAKRRAAALKAWETRQANTEKAWLEQKKRDAES